MKNIDKLAKVVVEFSGNSTSTTLYVRAGVVEYTESRNMMRFKGWPLTAVVERLRQESGQRIIIHNSAGQSLGDVFPYKQIVLGGRK